MPMDIIKCRKIVPKKSVGLYRMLTLQLQQLNHKIIYNGMRVCAHPRIIDIHIDAYVFVQCR